MVTAKVSLVVLDITLKLLISAKYLVVLAEFTFSWQIMYFAFLLVFCYVILVRLPPHPPPCEMLLIIFVFTLLTEEVRQVGVAKYWQKGFLDLRQFLLLRYGCCTCVCWRLVSRHDFFFHVDQCLVQLIFYFNAYHPAETVGIFKKKMAVAVFDVIWSTVWGGLQLQAEYEFEKHSALRLAYCPNLLATIQETPT